jgi:DNA invertase Pin-like site-specific DNA recombinase
MSAPSVTGQQAITVTPGGQQGTPATPLRVILYTRVSTDTQAEQGLGLAMQERAVRDWAKAHGHKIVAAYTDSGVSGSNGLDTRPGLAAAFGDLEDGKADALAVYRLDRLARKLASQETWIERLEQAGRQVLSVTEPQYGEDEMRTLVRQILGAVAQYERVVIVKRMQGGRRTKHERGGYAYGGPPYGWHAEGKELVPDPGEQAVRDRIHREREAGQSLRQIADALNAEGIAARRGRWHPQTVARALDRPDQHNPRSKRAPRSPRKQPGVPAMPAPAPEAASPAIEPEGPRSATPGNPHAGHSHTANASGRQWCHTANASGRQWCHTCGEWFDWTP